VARKKRSNAVKEPLQRWGVTDSGATCSRVGANYQVGAPPQGAGERRWKEWCLRAALSTSLLLLHAAACCCLPAAHFR
jgi:hypothetical protein